MSCGKVIEGLLLLIFANFCLLFLFFYVLCVGVGCCYLCVFFVNVFFFFFFLGGEGLGVRETGGVRIEN